MARFVFFILCLVNHTCTTVIVYGITVNTTIVMKSPFALFASKYMYMFLFTTHTVMKPTILNINPKVTRVSKMRLFQFNCCFSFSLPMFVTEFSPQQDTCSNTCNIKVHARSKEKSTVIFKIKTEKKNVNKMSPNKSDLNMKLLSIDINEYHEYAIYKSLIIKI